MKIYIYSDLHLECGAHSIDISIFCKNDIVILAGDICTWHNKTNISIAVDFLTSIADKVKYVLFVPGNHDYWGITYQKFNQLFNDVITINELCNVILLNDNTYEYNDILFVGCTLWTNFNNNPLIMWDATLKMNDYNKITWQDPGCYRKIKPQDTLSVFNKSLHFLKTTLTNNKHKQIIVITHHAPSILSVDEKHKTDSMVYAYINNLEELIYQYPNISEWIHGHIHSSSDYKINNTRILCNPYGYNFKNESLLNNQFINNLYIEK